MITILQRLLSVTAISIVILGCESKPAKKAFSIFGHVYRIDSVANQVGFADPFYIVITKDSLFQSFGYWDYAYPYETTLKINDSLQVFGPEKEKYEIEPVLEGFWLKFSDSRKHLYSVVTEKYDSAYKHFRMMKTQESLLLGTWRVASSETATSDILRCELNSNSILRFTRWGEHKIVQVENMDGNKLDTCLRRDFRLDGSAVLIFEYDGFPPFTILKLDKDNLILQGPGDILSFQKEPQ